jgi:hypothetical protein
MLSESTRTSELHHWKPRHVWPDLKVPFEIPEKTFPKEAMRANLFWTRSLTSTQKTQVQLFDRKGREDIKDELQRPSSLG